MAGAINILLTPGGIPLVPAMLASFQRSTRYKTRVIVADCNPASGHLFSSLVDARYTIPPITAANYIETMIRLIRKEKIAFWLSLLDIEQPLLAEHVREIEETGCILLRKPLPQFCNALDKSFVYKQLMDKINMPAMFFMDSEFNAKKVWSDLNGELIIKVCNSSGARNIFIPEDYDEYNFYIKKAKKHTDKTGALFVIQEIIKGDEYNTSMLHDKEGKYIYAVSRRKFEKRIIKNTTIAAAVEINSDVIGQSLEIVNCLSLFPGLNNIETIVSHADHKPYFIEINAGRTAAQDMNLIAAGINITDLLIDLALDKPCTQLAHPANGTAILKVLSDVVVSLQDVQSVPKI